MSTDAEALYDPQSVELASMPALQQALQQRALIASAVQPDGQHVLWLPLWRQETAYHCLEITQSTAFSPSRLDVIQGIFGVYHTYQSLLDYSERDALTGLLNRKTFDEQFLRLSLQRRRWPCRAWPRKTFPASGWPPSTSTISSASTTALATCMATRC